MKQPEGLEYFDPFCRDQVEKMLSLFNVTVDVRTEYDNSRHWGYIWKSGASQLFPESAWTEPQARAIVALIIYLTIAGVHVNLAHDLARHYIMNAWDDNMKWQEVEKQQQEMEKQQMKLLVNGRHLGDARFDSKNIESQFYFHEDSVTLRLDDCKNLAWWLEIDIPKETLQYLLKELEHEDATSQES